MPYRLAVFDFDGTIADTRTPITLSANRALVETGFPARADADVQELVGLPLERVMETLSGSAEAVEELCAAYRAAFREIAPGNSPLYDGVREAIEELRGDGLRLAIATSRSRGSLEMFLEQHALKEHFCFWAGGGCITRGKPHPEMLEYVLAGAGGRVEETLMIGDTTHDMEMGRAARIDTCAVTYGMHDAARLAASQPTYVVHHAREIGPVIRSRA